MLYVTPPQYKLPHYELLGGIFSFIAKYNIPLDDHLRYVLAWVVQTNRIKVWYDPTGNVKAVVWWINVSDVTADIVVSRQTLAHVRPWFFDSGPNVIAFAFTAHYNNFWIKTWLRGVLFRDVTLLIKKVEYDVPEVFTARKFTNYYAEVLSA